MRYEPQFLIAARAQRPVRSFTLMDEIINDDMGVIVFQETRQYAIRVAVNWDAPMLADQGDRVVAKAKHKDPAAVERRGGSRKQQLDGGLTRQVREGIAHAQDHVRFGRQVISKVQQIRGHALNRKCLRVLTQLVQQFLVRIERQNGESAAREGYGMHSESGAQIDHLPPGGRLEPQTIEFRGAAEEGGLHAASHPGIDWAEMRGIMMMDGYHMKQSASFRIFRKLSRQVIKFAWEPLYWPLR